MGVSFFLAALIGTLFTWAEPAGAIPDPNHCKYWYHEGVEVVDMFDRKTYVCFCLARIFQ